MNLFQIVLVPLATIAALVSLLRLPRQSFPKRQAIIWAVVWGSCTLLIADPALATRGARFLGIGRGSDLVFYLAILAGITISFQAYRRHRRLEILVTELVRRDAIQRAARGHPASQSAFAGDRGDAPA
jgi:hypothetical protein